MDTRQLSRIDLNLLVALQVLIEECNVSKSAERLFITQSAMSKTLGRLRELFDDPLFTRSSHGMVPTPKAKELQKKLTEVLQGVQGLVSAKEFDPWTFQGELKISVPEYIGMAVLPVLLEELQEEAPHLRLIAISRIEHQLEQLASGHLDLAIHVKYANYSQDYTLDPIANLPPVLLMRQGHPLLTQRKDVFSMEDMRELVTTYPQVRLYIPDLDEVDFGQRDSPANTAQKFAEVVFETSHMFTAIEVVKRTNCVLYGPPFITRHPQLGVGITSIQLPVGEDMYIHYVLASHRRVETSGVHQWLRQKIINIVHRFDEETESGDPYSDYKVGRRLGFFSPLPKKN